MTLSHNLALLLILVKSWSARLRFATLILALWHVTQFRSTKSFRLGGAWAGSGSSVDIGGTASAIAATTPSSVATFATDSILAATDFCTCCRGRAAASASPKTAAE